jgi:hypothetical protein
MAADHRLVVRLAALATLALVASACSRTEFAYRNADSLLEYYAWRTVRTSATQRDHLQPVLQSTLRHHREEELPLVIAYLDMAERIVRDKQGSPGAACLVDGALLLYERHARLAVDLAAPLLADLDAGQIRHLAAYTAKRQQDAVERYLNPDPQRRKLARQKRITERIEKWTGKLNDSQRQQIRDALERIPDLTEAWLSYRAAQTHTLLELLEIDANDEALRKHLDGWWVHRAGTSVETRQRWRIARRESVRLLNKLATTFTDKQLKTMEDRISDLRADLTPFLPSRTQPVDLQQVPACNSPSA